MRKNHIATATRGIIHGQGPNKTEAKADLERQIDHLCSTGPVMEARFGFLIVLTPMANCNIGTRIFRADDLNAHGRMFHHTTIGGGTMAAELMRARYNVAQNAWRKEMTLDEENAHTKSADLDEHHAAELRRWIVFQRNYLALKAEGKTDAEAHRLACVY